MSYQIMPDLTPEEYEDLKEDIRERGVMVPIEYDEDGNILDGFNRKQICDELGITDYPTVIRAGMTEEEKFTHARKLNLARRHLSQEQREKLIEDQLREAPEKSDRQIAEELGVDHKTVTNIRSKAGDQEKKVAEEEWATGEIPQLPKTIGSDGRERPANETQAERQREEIQQAILEDPEKSDRQIARETGANHHTVSSQRKKMVSAFNPSSRDAKALKDPDIVRRVAETGSNVAGAIREQKRDQLVEHLESVEEQEAKAAEGVYDVVVVDPPWPIQKMETDRRPAEVNMDYPVMTIDEIKALKIPAADDCHVFLWTTEKYLRESFDILESWGARYVLTFVWHKTNGGYKPIDLPIYNCEFCLYGRIGTPTFTDDHQFKACFETPITGHSEKPEEFYDMLRRVTSGRRLDMFNRRHIDGFDGWGNESPQ